MKEKYTWKRSDLIIPILAVGFSVYYIKTVIGVPFLAQMYGGGLSVVVLLLSAWIFILTIKNGAFKKSTNPTTIKEILSNPNMQFYRKAATLVGIMTLYVFFLPRLGFVISNFLLVSTVTYFLGSRDMLVIIRNATLVTLIGFCMFVVFLGVPLPLDRFSLAVRILASSMLR